MAGMLAPNPWQATVGSAPPQPTAPDPSIPVGGNPTANQPFANTQDYWQNYVQSRGMLPATASGPVAGPWGFATPGSTGYAPQQPAQAYYGNQVSTTTNGFGTQQITPPDFQGGGGLQSRSPWQAILGGQPGTGARAPTGWLGNVMTDFSNPTAFQLSGPALAQFNAGLGVYGARAGQNQANQRVIDAQGNVVNAQMGLQPYYQAHLNAQGGVLDAQGRQQALERAYLQSTGQNIQQSQQEANAIWAAKQDVGDLSNVAQVQSQQAAEDSRDRLYGVSAPQRIDVPRGQQGAALPPGVEATARPTFQYLSENAQHAQQNREFALETAKNAVDMAGTDVSAAQLIASRAGLSLDQAQQLVTQAQNQEAAARVGSAQAGLNLSSAELNKDLTTIPSSPGMVLYTDPATGTSSWMSPAQASATSLPAEAARTQALYGLRQGLRYGVSELAGFSDSYMGSLLVNGIADEQSIRAALAAKGYNQTKIEDAIAKMKLQKPAKKQGSSLGVGDILGGGSTVSPSDVPADNSAATPEEQAAIAAALGLP